MTPKYPWRRNLWRETVVPILWLLAAAVVIGGAWGIKAARTEPFSPGEAYAEQHAADICVTLDRNPTPIGVVHVLTALTTQGLSSSESGVAVKDSVRYVCPHHIPLLIRFVDSYRQHQAGVTL
ncbi:MAG: hypothetical protein M3Y83_14450 [Actinomycetota bacterium]|nr:hypothetical protein [Actinomycetota bacterium]